MQLSEIIIEKIRKSGPLSFRDFMEMCLYYPGTGYYTSSREKIGINGDYYTSPDTGTVFGAMLGRQFEEMWQLTGKKGFTIVEYGAGKGLLSHDILEFLSSNTELYSRLTYFIIEKSPELREQQKKYLKDKVQWIDSVHDIPAFTGCVFSNEVVDNFSVHRVVMQDVLMEVFVNYNGKFIEILRPADKKLTDYLSELNVILPDGFCTEINLEATEWIKEIACRLKKGFVLTIDYGSPSSDLYVSGRNGGTLLCYYKHTINDQPYTNIGEQDITSHVNFSALTHWGTMYGLDTCGLTKQGNLLMAMGFDDYLRQILLQERDMYRNFKQYRFLKYTLLLDMGQRFNVLIQSKNIRNARLRIFSETERIAYSHTAISR